MKLSKVSNKLKNSVWAKRVAKVGGAYIVLELVLVAGALVFLGV